MFLGIRKTKLAVFILLFLLSGCTFFTKEPIPGPDKQGTGLVSGTALGGAAGYITGFQLGHEYPGAWIGAGLGAIWGSFAGIGIDILEESQLKQNEEREELEARSFAQGLIAEHYAMRMALHPSRDIFPADWFFDGDSSILRPGAEALAKELGRITKDRKPWSRIIIAAYLTEKRDSEYSNFLTKKRAEQIALRFIEAGVEPRRVTYKGMTIAEPILIDEKDSPNRYKQAIEIIAEDN